MSPVSPALIDDYGCLMEGDKAVLVKSMSLSRLHVIQTWCWLMPAIFFTTSSGQSPGLPETWLQASAFDWPTTPLSPRKSFCSTYMTKYLPAQRIMWKRERKSQGSTSNPKYPLPCRELILHNSKFQESASQHSVQLSPSTQHQIVNMLDCIVTLDETDVTLCSYMLKAVAEGAQTIPTLSDDTDVFVLLVYWKSRMPVVAKIQMEWRCIGHQRNCLGG